MQNRFKFIIPLLAMTCMVQAQTQAVHSAHTEDKAAKINFLKPEDTRAFPLGKVDLCSIGGAMIGKAVFEPGWRWSTSVKPLVKTESCLAPHFQYHVSGTLRVQMDDGTIIDCVPGDVSFLPQGHDAWVIGNEPVVVIDFQGMVDYAKKSAMK